jgi:hypothetical protein
VPLDLQRSVLDLITQVTGGTMERKTPDWLLRPGKIECGKNWTLVCKIYGNLTGLQLPEVMPTKEWRKVDGVLSRSGFGARVIEVDESQHFNLFRAITLRCYSHQLQLAFDRKVWIDHSTKEPRQKAGGWAKPKPPLFPEPGGRHLQRAFRDALADILPPQHGFQPTLRIADFEVRAWLGTSSARNRMNALLNCKFQENSNYGQ